MAAARSRPGASAIAPIPNDPDAAIRYAQALRAIGQRAQAVAVLEQASIAQSATIARCSAPMAARSPTSAAYEQALEVLSRAHTPDQPDWRILSVQGAVLDQLGRHDEAQRYYASALQIVPDEPSVLSNLGLSYALSKDLTQAEDDAAARRARSRAPSRKVRQNLALVVGLQGRFAEAETIARADLPPDEARRQRRLSAPDAGAAERREEAERSRALASRRSRQRTLTALSLHDRRGA